MNFRKVRVYNQIIKTGIIRSLAYKFEVYINILMQTIIMIASAYFWKALFKNADVVQGVTVDTMLIYTVVSSMISIVLSSDVEWRIMRSVNKGTIAIDMMRPINVFSILFAEDIAKLISLFFQNLLPVFIIGSLIIGIPKPASFMAFILFLVSLIMAFFINWFIAVMFGMISFWAFEMSAIFQVKKHLIRLLSGSIIPIWFFPNWLRNVLNALPFAYLYQLPLDIYIGKATDADIVRGMLVQLTWLAIVIIMFLFFERRVIKKVMVQGG